MSPRFQRNLAKRNESRGKAHVHHNISHLAMASVMYLALCAAMSAAANAAVVTPSALTGGWTSTAPATGMVEFTIAVKQQVRSPRFLLSLVTHTLAPLAVGHHNPLRQTPCPGVPSPCNHAPAADTPPCPASCRDHGERLRCVLAVGTDFDGRYVEAAEDLGFPLSVLRAHKRVRLFPRHGEDLSTPGTERQEERREGEAADLWRP